MIYQDPLSALNPIQNIGKQISEALAVHGFGSGRDLKLRALTMLEEVGFPSPTAAYQSYPHQLSGGMRQRAMIAMALCPGPDILIADEPTTALDVTTQARIVTLLRNISEERKTALILITHDLGVAAGLCDEIHVMYAGRIVESARSVPLYTAPAHPYTEGLLAATLHLDADEREAPLTIPGQPPAPEHLPSGCAFHPRCHHSQELCRTTAPPRLELQGDRRSECHFAEEVLLKHAGQPTALSPGGPAGDWRE
jgi:oligopeptide/dipeptide ABC transporter ATP-binding protein